MVCVDKEETKKEEKTKKKKRHNRVKTKVTTELKRCSEYRFVKTELQQS